MSEILRSEQPEIKPPKSVEFRENQLIIDWDENPPHQSVFPISWIMTYAYDPKPQPESSYEIFVWDKAKLEAKAPHWFWNHFTQLTQGFFAIWKIPITNIVSASNLVIVCYSTTRGFFTDVKLSVLTPVADILR